MQMHNYLQNNFLNRICVTYFRATLTISHGRRENVPRRKIKKTKLSKNFKKKRLSFDKKISIDELPFTTVRVTIRALRWIFILIFIYMAVSIVLLLVQGGPDSITNIVMYSVTGFFTFFMGYFGWMFARNVMELVSGKKPQEDDF
jgi:hypothetical protein